MRSCHPRGRPQPAVQRGGCLAVFLAIGAVVAGCGENRPVTCPVHGKVTYQGKPVPRGTVLFNPVDPTQPPARGMIASDGTYELTTFRAGDGAVPGKHKIVINATTEVDPAREVGELGYRIPQSLVPAEYSSLSTTPLERTVGGPEKTIDLEL